jgi:hypothetical protein
MRNHELIPVYLHISIASVASAQLLKKKLLVHLYVVCVCVCVSEWQTSLRGERPIYGIINSLACSQTPDFLCHTLIKSVSMLDNIIEGEITFQGETEAPFLALKEQYVPISCILNTRTSNWITGSNYYVGCKLSVMLPVTGLTSC